MQSYRLFSLHIEQNPPNHLRQDSPAPCMPCKETLWQLTLGPSGTQWLEDLFHGKKKDIPLLILTLPPFLEPSQYNEPPIPGQSQSSKSQVPSHEDALACEPEPEVAPMQSMEDCFCDDKPIGAPPISPKNPMASSPQSQPPLIPTMRLGRN
ncbi:hypothetical protein O181_026271 [Austropuccinia psidii MF-1]|uniref:Uncharacterized protein n=1 Tax=Austropuccinia psidii MF-1 TaxID=1389203 RepID=A0A9Q3CK51_9BASI|nr:hypothetical protein [Austropuccinia psidii MF-1]